jgi:hypothetical protein
MCRYVLCGIDVVAHPDDLAVLPEALEHRPRPKSGQRGACQPCCETSGSRASG